MATAHDIWHTPFFWQPIRLRWNTAPLHRAQTTELDPPFRVSQPLVIHLWPTTLGVAVGRWQPGAEHDHAEEEFFLDDNVGRTEDDAAAEAIGLETMGDFAGKPADVTFPQRSEREYGPIVARSIYDKNSGEVTAVQVIEAPRFALIAVDLAEQLPRWGRRQDVVLVGRIRYWLHGLHPTGVLAYEAERIDRRSVKQFLFGGAQPWD